MKFRTHGWRWANAGFAFCLWASTLSADEYQDRLDQAIVLYGQNQLAEATDLLMQLTRSHPKQKEAFLWLGHSSLSQSNFSAARTAYSVYAGLAPADVDGPRGIARCWEAEGNQELAVSWYRKALLLEPGNQELRRTVAKLEGAPAAPSPPPARPQERWTSSEVARCLLTGLLGLVTGILCSSLALGICLRFPVAGILIALSLAVGNRTSYGLQLSFDLFPFTDSIALHWLAIFCLAGTIHGIATGLLLRLQGEGPPVFRAGNLQSDSGVPSPKSSVTSYASTFALWGKWRTFRVQARQAYRIFNVAQQRHRAFCNATRSEVGFCPWDIDAGVRACASTDSDLRAAEAGYLQSLDASQKLGEPFNVAGTSFALGCLYYLQGKYRDARQRFEACLDSIGQMPRLTRDSQGLAAWALLCLGVASAREGNTESAVAWIERSHEPLVATHDIGGLEQERLALERLGSHG